MHLGIDLVSLPKFQEKIKDVAVLKRLFIEQEISGAGGSIERLAGMYAAKEAFFKAIKKTPNWQAVAVAHDADGAPRIITDILPASEISVSISHDGEYAVAVVVVDNDG